MQIRYTLGADTEDDPYHVDIIKEKLTRSVPAILPEVIDELTLAVPQHIPAKTDGASKLCSHPSGSWIS